LTRFLLLLALILSNLTLYGQQKSFVFYEQKIKGSQLTIKMLPIPAGSFMMGSTSGSIGTPDSSPEHKVELSAFWMADLEITWNLYNLFLDREVDKLDPLPTKGEEVLTDVNAISGATVPYVDMSMGMGANGYPVINTTQLAVLKFCEWLSSVTGNFYRLPTEAEWEYACKAGTKTKYSFGDKESSLEDYAWYKENSMYSYHKVGLKKPNPWGLYDMHGNVAEWTLDQYIPELYGQRAERTILNPWEKQVKSYPISIRGGSWRDEAKHLASSARYHSIKDWKTRDPQIPKSKWWFTDAPFVGFRIVRPLETPSPEEQAIYWKDKH
jgi:formylglycine-generating enzyme required for sulfatase activity